MLSTSAQRRGRRVSLPLRSFTHLSRASGSSIGRLTKPIPVSNNFPMAIIGAGPSAGLDVDMSLTAAPLCIKVCLGPHPVLRHPTLRHRPLFLRFLSVHPSPPFLSLTYFYPYLRCPTLIIILALLTSNRSLIPPRPVSKPKKSPSSSPFPLSP